MMNEAIRQVAVAQQQVLSTAQMKQIRKRLFSYYKKKMKGQE